MSYDQLEELDRWALLRLGELIARVRRAYEEYQFHVVFHAAHNFCAVDLSALYLDIIKDRLYVSAAERPAAAGGADGVLRGADRARPAPGARPHLHRRGGVAHIPGRGKPESVHLGHVPRGARRVARRAARRRVGAPPRGARRGLARARGRAQAGHDRQGRRRRRLRAERARGGMAARSSPPRARPCSRRSSTSRACGSASARPTAPPSPTRARTFPGSSSRCCPPRRSAGRSASAAGPAARASGEDPDHPTLCERCRPSSARSARDPCRGDAGRGPDPGPGHQGPGARASAARGSPWTWSTASSRSPS